MPRNSLFQYIFFVTYLLLSLVFYKERVYYTDTAFYLFNIVQKESFFVAHERYFAVFFEILPVLLVKLHFPLKWVAMSFSLNVALFYIGIFLLLKKVIRSESAIWGLIFLLTLPVSDTFYFLAAEVIVGLSYVILFSVLVEKYIETAAKKHLIISILLIIFSIWIHPIVPLCMLGTIIFCAIDKGFPIKWGLIFPIFTAIFVILLRQKGFIGDWYDAQSAETLSFFVQKLQKEGWIYTEMIPFFLQNYLWKSLFLVWEMAVFAYLFHAKKYLMLAYWLGITLFFLFLAYLRNTDHVNYAYAEAYLLLVAFWAMLILGKAYTHYFDKNKVAYLGIALIIISLLRISTNSHYAEKVKNLDVLFAKVRKGEMSSKLIVNNKKAFFAPPLQGMDWALPYESLLQSSASGNPISVVLIDSNTSLSDSLFTQNDLFQAATWLKPIPQSELNPFYFGKLPKEKYVKMEK